MSANKSKHPQDHLIQNNNNGDNEKKEGENQNGLEKLIKLDKKHANFDMLDNILNKKLKIRNCPNQTLNLAQNNSTDYLLRLFWRHINGYYFRRIETPELERLDYIDQIITSKIKRARQKYQSFYNFWSIQDILQQQYLRNTSKDQNISKMNYKNLIKHIRIASEIYNVQEQKQDSTELIQLKSEAMVKNFKDNEIKALEDEQQKLDIIIEKIDQKHDKEEQQYKKQQKEINKDLFIFTLQDEIDYLQNELTKYTAQNKENIDNLQEKVRVEVNFGNVLFNQSNNGYKNPNCTSKLTEQYFELQKLSEMKEDHFNRVSGPINQDIQAQYLLNIIKKLEVIQIAESISSISGFKYGNKQDMYPDQIIDLSESENNDSDQQEEDMEEQKQEQNSKKSRQSSKKNNTKQQQKQLQQQLNEMKKKKKNNLNLFEVNFEYSVNPNSKWLMEEELLYYNSFRDNTLLMSYNTSQKSKYQHISQNKVIFDFIKNNRDKLNQKKSIDMKQILAEFKKSNQKSSSKEMRKFQICHHCKQFIHSKHLVPCTYKSSVLGLPILNQNVTDPFLSQQMELETIPKKPKFGCAQSYILKNNDYVCLRSFCKSCLKQNYDFVLSDLNKDEFLCPVCTGTCFCSRCLRSDMITKIKGMFLLYGGDPSHIYLGNKTEELLRPQIYEEVRKKFFEEIGSRNCEIKNGKQNNLRILLKMKNLKLDMHKMLLLSSAIMRREKLKTQHMISSVQLFQKKYEILTESQYNQSGLEYVDQVMNNNQIQNNNNIESEDEEEQQQQQQKSAKKESHKKKKKINEKEQQKQIQALTIIKEQQQQSKTPEKSQKRSARIQSRSQQNLDKLQ